MTPQINLLTQDGVRVRETWARLWLNAQLVQRVRDAGLQVPMTGMLFATGMHARLVYKGPRASHSL